jgi:hypothetical protein
VSSPSHPQPPADPAQPTTNEIPAVQPHAAPVTKHLPPHPGATSYAAQPASAVETPQPTGPVDFVPGLPGLGTPPPSAAGPAADPAAGPAAQAPSWPDSLESDQPARGGTGARAARLPSDRTALSAIGLAVLALVLLELGLAMEFGSFSLWSAVPLWSAFASVAALVGLLGAGLGVSSAAKSRTGVAWRLGAAGLVGLAVFWLLVVLPVVDSDRGFLLTAALAALGGALWVSAERA